MKEMVIRAWRRAFVGAGLAGVVWLAAPPAAWAQYQEMIHDMGPDIYFGESPALTPPPTGGAPVRTYVVKEGDTLWSIAEHFLGKADRWPELWGWNPQITNPHYIYPGDIIYLSPPPPPVEAQGAKPSEVQETQAKRLRPAQAWTGERFKVRGIQHPRLTRVVGFLGEGEYADAGALTYARETKEMLATWDEVYIEPTGEQQLHEGDYLVVYRRAAAVRSPGGGALEGRIVRFLGIVRIVDASHPVVRGVITQALEEIHRGDRVAPYFEVMRRVEPVPNDTELDGKVVAVFDPVVYFGQHQYVFVDRGSRDGVKVGNRFVVRERGDPYLAINEELGRPEKDFPWVTVGELLVVEAFEDHSLCLVTRSIHEFTRGTIAHLQKGY